MKAETTVQVNGQTLDYGIAAPRFRLPASTRLGAVRLQVSDLARSTAYYEQVIGLRTIERANDRVVLAAHGGTTPIVVLEGGHHPLASREAVRPLQRRGALGLYHFAILVPNRAALGRFLAHLSAIGAYAGMSDHAVSEAIYLTDPDGLGIEVYADRLRETWSQSGRELRMVTEPLDASDLVRAAGGEPWTGMPAGTAIGHVHLHVGDLDEAADFYHAALGFDKVVWTYPGALFLSAGGYHHHLGTNTWASRAPAAAADQARLLSWEIVVPEGTAEAAANSLRAAGYAVERVGAAWEARDPWGTPLRLVS